LLICHILFYEMHVQFNVFSPGMVVKDLHHWQI